MGDAWPLVFVLGPMAVAVTGCAINLLGMGCVYLWRCRRGA